ncbi:MAG: nucleotidyltransferase domain-containing protein [Archaeoglobaceae archaeon]
MASLTPTDKPVRLRDFIRADDWYFSVIGYRNDSGIKCFLRYIPHAEGNRKKEGKKFRKLLHREAIDIAIETGTDYFNGKIFMVPPSDVDEIFKPEERLTVEGEVGEVVNYFSGIPLKKMGVTGSRLIGLEDDDSDIDFVMYGDWWFRGREKIKSGIERGEIEEPDSHTWDSIFNKRKVNIPFNIFLSHEKRKFHRAVIGSTYFDLLYVRDYGRLENQVPEAEGEKKGKSTIEAVVGDDSLIFDYPAYYPVNHEEIDAVLCFTHTYTGQAFKGETLEGRGYVERINSKNYLIVGTEREVEDEYIVSLTFMDRQGLMEDLNQWKKQ